MRLEDICTVFTDGDWIESKDQSDEGIRLVQTGNIGKGIYLEKEARAKYISEDTFEKLKCTEIFPGDILVSRLPEPVGRACIIPDKEERMITAVDCTICRPDETVISKEYLCYFMRSNAYYTRLLGSVTGTTRKRISRKSLGNVELDVPSREKQNEVVEQLDHLVNVIDSKTRELQLLDDLIQARFVEMFGDPKLNDKGWNAGIISDYYEVKGGKRIPKGMGYADGATAHPYLRATDMKNETILDDDIHYIDEEVYEHIKRYTVKSGDIYLTNVGVNLGMAGVIPEKYDGANLTENAVKLVPKTEKVIDGVFFAHYINSPGIQDYINERKMSVGVPKLAIFRIETMPLLLPPMDIQMQFIEFHKQVNKLKVEVQKSLDETQTLFDSLMQKYFG
jgi:type I restriction enzyme S subunit